MQRTLLGTLALTALASAASAQLPDIAIVAAASASLQDCRYTDTQAYLLATGQFASVDLIDCTTTTPSLAAVSAYDAVLTWTNVSYFDGDALGDVMADYYYDGGGAVVVAVFATTTTTANRWLGGRWLAAG